MMDANQKNILQERIKARLEHIAGETQRGLYALKHGDEEDLGLALMSLKRISFEAAQQFQEMSRHSKPARRIHTHSASHPKAHYKHS